MDIPGFYFDHEKNKYFKIQPNHLAPGSQYSREAVREKEIEQKKINVQQTQENRERLQRIERDPRIHHPLTTINRRLGAPSSGGTSAAAAYYGAALKSSILMSFGARQEAIIHPQFGVQSGGNSPDVLLALNQAGSMSLVWRVSTNTGGLSMISNLYDPKLHSVIGSAGPKIGSMLFTRQGAAVWTDDSLNDTRVSIRAVTNGEDSIFAPEGPTVVYTLQGEQVIALAESPSGKYWATVSDSTIRIGQGTGHDSRLASIFSTNGVRNEFLAMSFRDEYTLMTATRSNFITFIDHRAGPGSTKRRFKHDDAVNALTMLKNDNHVLVNGLTSTKIYDLRYTAAPPTGKVSEPATKPFLSFSIGARTSDRPRLGFDYDPDLNLVAVPNSRGQKRHNVTLYSTITGKMVPSPLNHHVFDDQITCLKFARIRDGTKSLLMVPKPQMLQEWCVQGLRESDDAECAV